MGQIEKMLPPKLRVFAPRWKMARNRAGFSTDKHAGLIILGDSRHWATSRKYQLDRDWLVSAIESGTPILGICFGAQLLAVHLDERKLDDSRLSTPQTKEHFGKLTEIDLDDAGKSDPVVSHFAGGIPVAQYHMDYFRKPRGAIALAWSNDHSHRHCEAFRVGKPEAAVYGLQFHPEPTLEMLQTKKRSEQWFKVSPSPTTLSRVVKAGQSAIQAWINLATARRRKKS